MNRENRTGGIDSLWNSLYQALRRSFRVSLLMIKVYLPLSLLTIVLRQWGVIDAVAPLFAPIMRLMGLPGEAAITLVAGFSNSIYAALATIAAFDLSARQITILGVVLGIAHSLFVETGVLTKLQMANVKIAFFRIGAGVATGTMLNAIMPQEISGPLPTRHPAVQAFTWSRAFTDLAVTSAQIVLIISCIMLFYELLSFWKHSAAVKRKLEFLPSTVGMGAGALGPWIVGFFVGITYGAAVLFQFAQENRLTHKDACLITVFLCLCHAMVEDVMLFVVFGGNFWWIFLTRFVMAIVVVRVLAIRDLYQRFLWIGLPAQGPRASAESTTT